MWWSRVVLAVLGFASTALLAHAAPLIRLDSVFADDGRLACGDKPTCVAGRVFPYRTSAPFDQNIFEVHVSIAELGLSASAFVPLRKGGAWKACFSESVPCPSASSELPTERYLVDIHGRSNSGELLETVRLRSMSLGHGLVFDGQSNMMYPSSVLLGANILLTNYTKIMNEWASHQYYGIAIMMLPGQTTAAFASDATNVFPAVTFNWTRSDHANFWSAATSFGWLSLVRCIEHAKRFGPTHCLQIAVATTRLATHMAPLSYMQSGATERKPFTTVGGEGFQLMGGLWNGAKMPIENWDPNVWDFYQGESDWATPFEYAGLLQTFLHDLRKNWKTTKFVVYGLAPFAGWGTQPIFNLTARAQRGVVESPRWQKHVCFVVVDDLGYFSSVDGGLHPIDTKYDAALRATLCTENLIANTNNLVRGPVVSGPGQILFWNATSGVTTVRLLFQTERPAWSRTPADVTFRNVKRTTTSTNGHAPVWHYEQWHAPQASVTMGTISEQVITTSGQTLDISFVVAQPSAGAPTQLIYGRYGGGFPLALITNDPSSVKAIEEWTPSPLPARPFSIPLVVA